MIYRGKLETGRLIVRPFEKADAPALVALFSDERVARFVGEGEALAPDDAALWVERSNANLRQFGYGTGAVIERASAGLIGWAGFARPPGDFEEIIFGLDVAHWRRGYGRELVAALLDYADHHLRADTVRATVDPANDASIRLLTGHGFVLAEQNYRGAGDCALYIRTGRAVPRPV